MTPVTPDAPAPTPASTHTVEEVVRKQLSDALGGARGMLEAAVPTIAFTVLYLTQHHNLRLAIIVSVGCAGVLLAIRLAQRSSPQFVLNALFGIGLGALFAWRAARGGGDAGDQALAFFLPGLIYNFVYGLVMLLTIAIRWPLVGFIVGSVAGDPTAWHADKNVVRLCSRLTWLLALPCVIRVLVQGPIYLAGRNGWWSTDSAVAALGVAKLTMGWPLQVAALAAMVWVLTRNSTPLPPGEPEPHLHA
jgi:small-conductance mechanosensitive channel